jgi:ParB-like nuclease domain
MEYTFHELCLAVPEMKPAKFDELCQDIKENGLIHPIILFQTKILDGRSRYLACKATNVTPHFRNYEGDKPDKFVISMNVKRRQMDITDIALTISRIQTIGRAATQFKIKPINPTVSAQAPTVQPKADEGSTVSSWELTVQPKADEGSIASENKTEKSTMQELADTAGISIETVKRAKTIDNKGTQELNKEVFENKTIGLKTGAQIAKLKEEEQNKILKELKAKKEARETAKAKAKEEKKKSNIKKRYEDLAETIKPETKKKDKLVTFSLESIKKELIPIIKDLKAIRNLRHEQLAAATSVATFGKMAVALEKLLERLEKD